MALLARQDEVLLHTAQFTVRWLAERFEYRQAAEMEKLPLSAFKSPDTPCPWVCGGQLRKITSSWARSGNQGLTYPRQKLASADKRDAMLLVSGRCRELLQ
jgi:hypothetical protein